MRKTKRCLLLLVIFVLLILGGCSDTGSENPPDDEPDNSVLDSANLPSNETDEPSVPDNTIHYTSPEDNTSIPDNTDGKIDNDFKNTDINDALTDTPPLSIIPSTETAVPSQEDFASNPKNSLYSNGWVTYDGESTFYLFIGRRRDGRDSAPLHDIDYVYKTDIDLIQFEKISEISLPSAIEYRNEYLYIENWDMRIGTTYNRYKDGFVEEITEIWSHNIYNYDRNDILDILMSNMIITDKNKELEANQWNDLIYYSTEDGLFLYDITTNKTSLIFDSGGFIIKDIAIVGGKLFFTEKHSYYTKLYYVANWDGTDAKEIIISFSEYQTYKNEESGIQISFPAEWFCYDNGGSYPGGIIISSPKHNFFAHVAQNWYSNDYHPLPLYNSLPIYKEGVIITNQGLQGKYQIRMGEHFSVYLQERSTKNVYTLIISFEYGDVRTIDDEVRTIEIDIIGDIKEFSDELLEIFIKISESLLLFEPTSY